MKEDNRPHILFITADELRADALGCYGGRVVQTPSIDALAGGGTRFDAAYAVSPQCLPSRWAILTGRYPSRTGAYSNFRAASALSPAVPNLYNLLRGGGYRTAHVGKCHYSPFPYGKVRADEIVDAEPHAKSYILSLGLDHLDLESGSISSWSDYTRDLDSAGHGYLMECHRASRDASLGNVYPFPAPAEWHPDAWTGRKAVEYLGRCEAGQPNFLWVSFNGPHYPFDAPAEFLDRVDPQRVGGATVYPGEWDDQSKIQAPAWTGIGQDHPLAESMWWAPDRASKNFSDEYWRRLRRSYFAKIALVDHWVGQIVAAAHRRWGDNVLIVFSADHGELAGEHGLWGKNTCGYEPILRVPLLVRTPSGPMGPAITDAPAMLIDLLPTFLRAAGIGAPRVMDGCDLDRRVADPRPRLLRFAECENFAAVSDGRWKYLRLSHPARVTDELYDLSSDPHEVRNLAADPGAAGELSRLRSALVDHFMQGALA